MKNSPYDIAYLELRRILKDLREAKQLTQAQLARKLSVPQSFVSKYETGERRIDVIETAQICRALETSMTQLLSKLSKRLKYTVKINPKNSTMRGT
ncbi:MAG: helix-turn-helix transcriptional regulator [Nitrospirae bacterium]|nr:helix-turn-helix transcriptional regulator [Nitrospirota bacterium]